MPPILPERTILDRLLHQERTPICTIITLLTTAGIEALIVYVAVTPVKGYEGVGMVLFTLLFVLVAITSNIAGGWVALKRGEFWGGRIAVLGIAVWIGTLAIWMS